MGAILILSGPSGAGKSTIINEAAKDIGEFYFSISTTTRQPREGEQEGVDYYFVDKAEFERGIDNGEFLEYAQVHGNYYGTSLKPVYEALSQGKLVIFDIDVQGHTLAREVVGDLVTSAFIVPPSLSALEHRLRARLTDSDEIICQRLENAQSEIREIGQYDFLIINDDLQKATREFIAVAQAARLKMSEKAEQEFIVQWLNS